MKGSSRGIDLHLDHASVAVPELSAAVEHLDVRLGLRATVTAADPARHSRIYLDRSYVEVAAQAEMSGWHPTHFFLRFEDEEALRAHLDECGVSGRFGVYEGVDGRWDDVEVEAPSVPLPILTRRTDPLEVARRWPPPLTEPHRCGARTLAAVQIGVTEWEAAVDAYGRLLGPAVRPTPAGRTPDGRRRTRLPLATGHLVLVEAEAEGVDAIILGVASLAETVRVLGRDTELAVGDRMAWLDPAVAFGLRVGFVETGSKDHD